jgi:hypothetical protein
MPISTRRRLSGRHSARHSRVTMRHPSRRPAACPGPPTRPTRRRRPVRGRGSISPPTRPPRSKRSSIASFPPTTSAPAARMPAAPSSSTGNSWGPSAPMSGSTCRGRSRRTRCRRQGIQSPFTPRQQYRLGLAALAEHCRASSAARPSRNSPAADQDKVLTDLEKGDSASPASAARCFFNTVAANTMEGFFADPIYGGNKDMAAGSSWASQAPATTSATSSPIRTGPTPGRPSRSGPPRMEQDRRMTRVCRRRMSSSSGLAGPARSWRMSSASPASTWWRWSAVRGATRRATSTSAPRRTSCATPCARTSSCARRRKPSRSATSRTSWRCRSANGAASCPAMAWAAPASTGMARPGASCPRTSSCEPPHPTLRRGFLPEHHTIQDWGVTYQELEPYYDRFEKIAGISGKAGNLNGVKQDGGNPSRVRAPRNIPRRR